MDEDEAYPSSNIKLIPCDICGRKFNQISLSKHRQVCKKIVNKGRKTFDSGRQRATGSDVIYAKTKETQKVEPPSSNWREKHNEFIKNIRQARNISEAIKTGAPIPKYEPNAVPSDYVNCPYCFRNFSRNAADRHIPFCETQSKRQKINNSANSKLKPKQQAPSSGQRKQSSEVYDQHPQSNSRGVAGYQSGNANKGFSSGNERRPIKYDQNPYYESDTQDYGNSGGYAMKNKAAAVTSKSKQEMLRTGRNTTNSELNALARNRGGTTNTKESPINSRRVPQQQQQAQAQNGSRGTNNARGVGQQQQQHQQQLPQQQYQQNSEGTGSSAKFCHECGSEFPVQWARFCSFCGDRRL